MLHANTFSILMVLLKQLQEPLLTHIIPQSLHIRGKNTHAGVVSAKAAPPQQQREARASTKKRPLQHPMNIQLLLLRQAGNTQSSDRQVINTECATAHPTRLRQGSLLPYIAIPQHADMLCLTQRQALPPSN